MRLFDYVRGAKGRSGFGSGSTAEDVTAGIDLSGKYAVVTGSGSGLGRETARVLALRGAHVVVAVRSLKSGEETARIIRLSLPNAEVAVMEVDLSSLASVRSFAEAYRAEKWPLHILINNAGIMACPFTLSADGHELQFATNHLGHFLLVNELLPLLKQSANASNSESRIVNVASMAHEFAKKGVGVDFEKMNSQQSYKPLQAYGQSKLANILHAKELAARLKADGVTNVTANALCPGAIATSLQRHVAPALFIDTATLLFRPLVKSIPQGAATSCFIASSPSLEGVSGKYFFDCNEGEPKTPEARDMDLGRRLWEYSEKAVM